MKKPIKKIKGLIAIGYWKSEGEPHLPHPKEFQDDSWGKAEKDMVINHIKNGKIAIRYRGSSFCRFNCGELNMGTTCLTDGIYIFPEKLSHYLELHDVRLPEKFIDHIKRCKLMEGDFDIQAEEVDYSWWEKAKLN